MAIPSFDLIDIIRTIQKKRLFIIIIVIVCMGLGAAFTVVKRAKYKAESSFLVGNPLYTDRNSLFRSTDSRYMDYYAGEEDVDKVIALSSSDTVVDRIIRNSDFHVIYKQDINDPNGHASLMSIFKKNFNLKKTEYRSIEVSYVAYDAQTAANVVNMSVKVLEDAYRNYFSAPKKDIYTSINAQVLQLNTTIDSLTDSLAAMRDRYGIYSLVSPARANIINGDIKGSKGFGMAIEQIQNLESIKDQLVADRAHYISVLNEFSTSVNESMTYLKVITRALPPQRPHGLSLALTAVVGGFLGLLFSVLFVLITAYLRKLNEVL